MEFLQCGLKGFAQNSEMAGAPVTITEISSAIDIISHIVPTQPRDCLAGLAELYQDRRDPDPAGEGEK